jgi:uncharacterized membrane protein
MDERLWLDVLSRIIHVGTAIVLVGGTVFVRFLLLPAADKLSPESHETLRASIGRVWKFFVHVGIVLFLLSGFYNYLVVTMPGHRGDSLYHMLIGIKILLALVVFFLAEVLVGRAPAFEKMRQNRKTWLGVIIVLAAVIVAISGYLKVGRPPKPPELTTSLRGGEHLVDGVPQFVHTERLA